MWHLDGFSLTISFQPSLFKFFSFTSFVVRGGLVGWGTVLQGGRLRVRFPIELMEFFLDLILPAIDSASSKNEYKGYILGVKTDFA
jgi:hypothetical protein